MGACIEIVGEVCSGLGLGEGLTQLDWVVRQFQDKLGFTPYPGTFNLRPLHQDWAAIRAELDRFPGIVITPPAGFCAARCYKALLGGAIQAAVIFPDVDDYPADKLELVAAEPVRQRLNAVDGQRISLLITC